MHFQNIHTLIYQKVLLHMLLLLVFKIVESLPCILKSDFNLMRQYLIIKMTFHNISS